jgi:hypothetical protein
MFQDTVEVLVYVMAIDRAKRFLSAERAALQRVLDFTIDGDVLDGFCTEERDVVPASANCQPLRTPSLQAPAPRQLSAIPDNESYTNRELHERADVRVGRAAGGGVVRRCHVRLSEPDGCLAHESVAERQLLSAALLIILCSLSFSFPPVTLRCPLI